MVWRGRVYFASDRDGTMIAYDDKDLVLWIYDIPEKSEQWHQMFIEAWRLERDYFYDHHMNGVDWPVVLKKYLPLVGRVTDRAELSDLLGQMVSELSALHIFVYGGARDVIVTPISPDREAGLRYAEWA